MDMNQFKETPKGLTSAIMVQCTYNNFVYTVFSGYDNYSEDDRYEELNNTVKVNSFSENEIQNNIAQRYIDSPSLDNANAVIQCLNDIVKKDKFLTVFNPSNKRLALINVNYIKNFYIV
jgi:hypothetical protein